jgi:hypothetical protein
MHKRETQTQIALAHQSGNEFKVQGHMVKVIGKRGRKMAASGANLMHYGPKARIFYVATYRNGEKLKTSESLNINWEGINVQIGHA